ncbi:hypothetical protein BJX64DRAFT_283168 [Aspergillus heterothallicus]
MSTNRTSNHASNGASSTNNIVANTTSTRTPGATANRTWIVYNKDEAPTVGSRAYGCVPLQSGHMYTDWGTVVKVTTLPRVVIVKPIEGQKDKLTPTTSISRDMGTSNPAVGCHANGLWEPTSGAGASSVIHYGLGEVVAVFEDVNVYEVRRAGAAVHPENPFLRLN